MLKGVRVLVVDAVDDEAEMYRLGLAAHHADVTVARTAAEALGALSGERPDALVVDVDLPDASGHDLARRVRALGGPPPHAVAVTGWVSERDRREALAAGFDALCTKPCEPDELARLVARVLGRGAGRG